MLSIPAQLDELRKVAARRGMTNVEERTEHCSAREPGRPVFSKLLAEISRGEIHGVVCWTLDRLARNPIDGAALTHYLGKGLLREIVTHDAVYTGTGDTKFMLQVLFGAATKMTDDLSDGVRRGNRAVHESGRITGRPPLGYAKVRETRFERGAAPVVPDPERFDLVRAIWTDMLTGTMTVSDAWRRAVERGLRTRPTRAGSSNPVSIQTVDFILRSPFYAGRVVRCEEEFAGEHEPMVTQAEFARVQELIARRSSPRPRRHSFLYAGLLHCGHCNGALLVGEHARGRSRYYPYYRCRRREGGRLTCRAPGAREEQVTADIAAYLESIALPAPLLEWSREAMSWWYEQRGRGLGDETTRAEERLRIVERRLTGLTDGLIDGLIDKAEYVDRKAEYQAEVQALRSQLDSPVDALDAWRAALERFLERGAKLGTEFHAATDEERRLLLGEICSNHVVRDRKTAPILRFPYSLLAEWASEPHPSISGGSNRLPTPESVLNATKNARTAEAVTRDLQSWWTKLVEARTCDRSP